MENVTDIDTQAAELQTLMQRHMGVKGRDFGDALNRAGRRLPRKIRTQAREIVEAQHQMHHPKLRARLDGVRLQGAFQMVQSHLKSQDLADRRRGKLLSMLGSIAFNLILVAVGFIVWLWWRDYI
jgi:hypothetical protein